MNLRVLFAVRVHKTPLYQYQLPKIISKKKLIPPLKNVVKIRFVVLQTYQWVVETYQVFQLLIWSFLFAEVVDALDCRPLANLYMKLEISLYVFFLVPAQILRYSKLQLVVICYLLHTSVLL